MMEDYHDCHDHCLYGCVCRIMRVMDNEPRDCDEFAYWDHLSERNYREEEED